MIRTWPELAISERNWFVGFAWFEKEQKTSQLVPKEYQQGTKRTTKVSQRVSQMHQHNWDRKKASAFLRLSCHFGATWSILGAILTATGFRRANPLGVPLGFRRSHTNYNKYEFWNFCAAKIGKCKQRKTLTKRRSNLLVVSQYFSVSRCGHFSIILTPLGRCGVPFWRPLEFEGVPKSCFWASC